MPAIAALSVGLLSLLLALDEGADRGWTDPLILGLLRARRGDASSPFAAIERRAGETRAGPARRARATESFAASCLATLLMSAIFFAALLYLPQFMAKQLGYSALEAGVGLLPMMGTFALVSFIAGPLYDRLGAKPLVVARRRSASPSASSCSRWSTPRPGYDALVPGMVVLGIGRRQLLLDRDHRRRHRGRRVAGQPCRRHHLHVPDRRRLDRTRADDDGLLLGGPALRRRCLRPPSGSTLRSRWLER